MRSDRCGLGALKAATTVDELLGALDKRLSPRTLNGTIPAGSMYLQPTEERRRTGSHYTPRSLTEPIVSTTLRPILEAIGERPTARSDSRSESMRSGDGLRRLPGRSLSVAGRPAGRRHGRRIAPRRRFRPMRTLYLYARRMVAQTLPLRRG